MEKAEEGRYQVIITDPAEISFYEILDYLYDNYPFERAEEIANELRDTAQKLHYHPERGTLEPQLSHRTQSYRYVLYKRTSRAEVKIIYYIDRKLETVYVMDFFPTEKDNTQLSKRNM
ncbi:MAG: type II toxin-antitoxin system RelE/ParE family toxin [Cyclobacteriaceae bacterium]|nr:type II toxin-antitoxin system RelE/ParE family toxin [Cyclobacteriaceae bacterium]